MPRGGVLVCGNIVADILVRAVDRVRWGRSTWVESIEQHLGGNGASTSVALGKLGVPVRLLSAVGLDGFGDQALERLRSAAVDVSPVSRLDGPTPASVVLVNSAGDRSLLHRPGAAASAFAEPVEFDAALTAGMSSFHLANLFALPLLRRHAAETIRRAKAAGLVTSLDTGWDARGRWMEDLRPCLPHTDFLFVNEDEAGKLSGTGVAPQAASRLRGCGARTVVLKLGARGSAIFTADGEILTPAFDVPAVDTTGAGDCFAGAFLAALSRGLALENAARFANAAAALAIQQLGATNGLRSWDDTRAWMESAPVRRR
jgi:sugar/nucleoside kinase (ribokinase family)